MRTIIAFWFIFLANVFMVYHFGLAQNVFTISTEPRPAQFYRYNPKLYHRPDGGFMIAWNDFREGIGSFYAQHFDSKNRRIGDNFKIFAHELVAFGPEEKFLVVVHESFIYHRALAQLYGPSGPIQGPIELTRFRVPTDYFGCPAFGSFLGSIPSGYLFADIFLGAVKFLQLDHELNQTYTVPSESLPMDARGFAITSTSNGAFVLYWFGSYVESSEKTQLYGKFFDENHEVIADSVFLGDRWNTCDVVSPMHGVTLQDSLYQLFFSTMDTLWYLSCDRKGNIVHEVNFLVVERPPGMPPLSERQTTFGISNIVDGAFFLVFGQLYSWYENDEFKRINQTSLHEFGVDGQTKGDFLLSYQPYQIKGNVHRLNQNHFQFPLAIDKDIFLSDFNRNLSLVDSVKVNEDSVGANQRNPISLPAPTDRFLVLWADEVSKKARMLNADGSLIGSEFVPPIEHGQFFPTQEFLTTWITQKDCTYAVGYRIYSQDWQVIEEREIAKRTGNVQWVRLSTHVVDENSFLAFLHDSTELRLLSISKVSGVLRDTLLAEVDEHYLPLRITSDGNGIYWALWQSYKTDSTCMRAYDINFKVVSDLISNKDVNVEGVQFLPEGRYGFLISDPQQRANFLVVKDATQQEPINTTKIGGASSYGFQLTTLDKSYFLIKWVENHEVFLQAFDQRGLPIKEPLAVYASPSSRLMSTGVVTNGSNVLLTWADITTPGHGYDILGRILTTSTIVSVKAAKKQIAEFSLKQNYPNPFNPQTTIEYDVFHPSYVTLTIYNISGQKVQTLVDKWQPQGSFRVEWDGGVDSEGSLAASGIYFYELKIDDQILARRKMVFIR